MRIGSFVKYGRTIAIMSISLLDQTKLLRNIEEAAYFL